MLESQVNCEYICEKHSRENEFKVQKRKKKVGQMLLNSHNFPPVNSALNFKDHSKVKSLILATKLHRISTSSKLTDLSTFSLSLCYVFPSIL